jgi:hypothetical protein
MEDIEAVTKKAKIMNCFKGRLMETCQKEYDSSLQNDNV